MRYGYTVKVIRSDGTECGEIQIPQQEILPSSGRIGAEVLESIRRGEDPPARRLGQ